MVAIQEYSGPGGFFASHFLRLCGAHVAHRVLGLGQGQSRDDETEYSIAASDEIVG